MVQNNSDPVSAKELEAQGSALFGLHDSGREPGFTVVDELWFRTESV